MVGRNIRENDSFTRVYWSVSIKGGCQTWDYLAVWALGAVCYSPGPLYRCQRIVNKAKRREQEGSVLGCTRVCLCVLVFVFVSVHCCVHMRCVFFFFFFWSSCGVFVCMTVCGCVSAPFGLYPKAVLQAHETSERERKSLGRLWDISREHLSRLRIPQQSQRKLPWSLMKLLWGPGRAGPSPNHWFRVSKVFILLMLKVSGESRVIWPQICDYRLMLHDGLWSSYEGTEKERSGESYIVA